MPRGDAQSEFSLDPAILRDTLRVGELPLSRLVLMNDARYPWFVLVPRRQNIREIFELEPGDQSLLLQESTALAKAMTRIFKAHKMNVAALGNVVPQLHVHHIARFTDDDAWPAPVWGKHPSIPYSNEQAEERIHRLKTEGDLPFLD